jgi:hypothetical protein
MSTTANASTVRLEVTTRSVAGTPIFDIETGDWPSIFKSSAVNFDVGVFSPDGTAADLSTLSKLTLQISPYTGPTVYLGYPAFPVNAALVSVDVLANALVPTISRQRWEAGLVQNATFAINQYDTQFADLLGNPFLRFQLLIIGTVAATGARVVYASGPIIINDSYEMNAPATFTGTQSVTNTTGQTTTITIDAGRVFLTVFATITGTAGTRNFIFSATNALDGAKITVVYNFPSTSGIAIRSFSDSLSSEITQALTTSDGTGIDVTINYTFNGSTWIYTEGQFPN